MKGEWQWMTDKKEIPCPDCSSLMLPWLEGKDSSGKVRDRVRCKQCRRWKWKDE